MRPQIAVFVDPEDDIHVFWTPHVTSPGTLSIEIGHRTNLYFEGLDGRRRAYAMALDIITALESSKRDESNGLAPVSEPRVEGTRTVLDVIGVRDAYPKDAAMAMEREASTGDIWRGGPPRPGRLAIVESEPK
jgi:hypothetical protein